MMKLTRIFDRLPSDAGVTFEGFENIIIKSRESVKEQLEKFVEYCRSARKPAIRVVLGEWGEGKTDAYKRYIEPKARENKSYAFFVSASTLSNGYEIPHTKRLLDMTSLEAVRFLVVLFSCIREESEVHNIPKPEEFTDPHRYLNEVLKNLIGEDKTRRIFIFIDEFEELLLEIPKLKAIIRGIKETINGQFATINENGEYEGCLHIIIAVTPDAYYRLQVAEETALIFGGLGRREGIIELPQIRKGEGIEFLYALLEYSYNNELPHPLPFKNAGIFHALFRIAQGNPGALVSLFTRLMNSAKVDDHHVKVIDYNHFLEFLTKEWVFVYGAGTQCLESETFNRILKIVGDQKKRELGQKCETLLKILCGELKPFSPEELRNEMGITDKEVSISTLINTINQSLSREGIKRAIFKLSPLREGKTFNDVIEALKEYISTERGRKSIKIDNYFDELTNFEDKITYFSIEGDKIIPQIYLPFDEDNVLDFFEGISRDRATEIKNCIKKLCREDEYYYLASDYLLSQIFPTPIPRELEFVKNRELRLKLWREVTRKLAEEYERHMVDAFTYLLEKSELFKLTKTERRPPNVKNVKFVELEIDGMKVKSIFYSVNGDVRSEDIETIDRLIKSEKPTHCVVLLYTGEITDDARKKIDNKELGKEGDNVILEVHLHPTLAKRILCIYKATLQSLEIDENSLKSAIRKIVVQDLNFENKVKEWLKFQKEIGILVDLFTSDAKSLGDALKFYINFMGEEYTVEEIFHKNEELLKFTKFEAKKVGIVPDIELPRFKELSEELKNNGFLFKNVNDKYKILEHPVERRVRMILKRENKLTEDELVSFFITKDPKILKNFFLSILEYKGLVKRERNYYSLNNPDELFENVNQLYQEFKERIERKPEYHKYGYVFMTKQKGERLITLEKIKILVDELYQKLQNSSGIDEEIMLQKSSLLIKLLQHFLEEFFPLFDGAIDESKKILEDIHGKYSGIESSLNNIKEECYKWLKLKLDVKNIEEFKEIKKIKEEVEKCKEYEYEDIVKEMEKIKRDDIRIRDIFYYRNTEKDTYYFNPKLYLISLKKEEFDKKYKSMIDHLEKLNDHFKSFNEKLEQLKQKIKEKEKIYKDEEKALKISAHFFERLEELTKTLYPEVQELTYERVKLSEITNSVNQNVSEINSKLKDILECLEKLEKIYNTEQSFINVLRDIESKRVPEIFDIENYDMSDFTITLNNVKEEYNKILGNLENTKPKVLKELLQQVEDQISKLEKLGKDITDKRKKITELWEKYCRETNDYLNSISYTLNLLEDKIDDKEIPKIISDEIKKIRNITSSTGGISFGKKLSEIEKMKSQIREKLYKAVKPLLEEKELRILEFVIQKKITGEKDWWSIQDLYQAAKDKFDIQKEEVEKILQNLVKQGLLCVGLAR